MMRLPDSSSRLLLLAAIFKSLGATGALGGLALTTGGSFSRGLALLVAELDERGESSLGGRPRNRRDSHSTTPLILRLLALQ